MRWWPIKMRRKAPHPNGSENGGAAELAKSQAEQKLRDMIRRSREVEGVVKENRTLRDDFGHQIQRSFRRAT